MKATAGPAWRAAARPVRGRIRLGLRWARFGLRSALGGHRDFAVKALVAELRLARLSLDDLLRPRKTVECNICGWGGRQFYPNTGPGYDELGIQCPGCLTLDRHRALVAILASRTDFFAPGTRIIEVAPTRGLELLLRSNPDLVYTSFDLSRSAMEKGNITQMSFPNASADYFVCFHVLEHVTEEERALTEIRRVLKPGGCAVLQVPMDDSLAQTVEYGAPDPREAGHVRRYGRDFPLRVGSRGFAVEAWRAADVFATGETEGFGLSNEPIFFARRPR